MAATICRANFKKIASLWIPSTRSYATEKSINQVTLVGLVDQAPQIKGTEEKPVTVFSLATTDTLKSDSGEFNPETVSHRVHVYQRALGASVNKYLQEGSRCLVKGKLVYWSIRDEEESERPPSVVFAHNVIFLGKRLESEAQETEIDKE